MFPWPQHSSSHKSPLLVVCISSPTWSTLGHSNHACDTPPLKLQTLAAITPTSDKIEGFSGEAAVRSNAAGFPRDQLGTRTSAGLVLCLSCPKPLPTSTWADTLARLQHFTKFIVEEICEGKRHLFLKCISVEFSHIHNRTWILGNCLN